MKTFVMLVLIATTGLFVPCSHAGPESPYAGEEHREIKSLSKADIESLLAGEGIGYAKSAELNGWPGPKHVLELAGELKLSAQQRTATEKLFARMKTEAMQLGQLLIREETSLGALFAAESPAPETVAASAARIGEIEGRLRAVHLNAHVAQAAILDQPQMKAYFRLRGYIKNGNHDAAHQH